MVDQRGTAGPPGGIGGFCAVMLCAGTLSVVFSKLQDVVSVGQDENGNPVTFKHPILQSGFMFMGEFLCIIYLAAGRAWAGSCQHPGGARGYAADRWDDVRELLGGITSKIPFLGGGSQRSTLGYLEDGWGAGARSALLGGEGEGADDEGSPRGEDEAGDVTSYQILSPGGSTASARRRQKSFLGKIDHRLVFALPAACDMTASAMLNLGLFYTYTSVYQMLRGTLVIFTGLFTVMLLKRRLFAHHWTGLGLICTGAVIVGLSSTMHMHHGPAPPAPSPTPQPTMPPTPAPTPQPTTPPTPAPTELPTPSPTNEPTPSPTEQPTPSPTNLPTPSPTELPTPAPTSWPPAPEPTPELPTPEPSTPGLAVGFDVAAFHLLTAEEAFAALRPESVASSNARASGGFAGIGQLLGGLGIGPGRGGNRPDVAPAPALGDILVVISQTIQALQVVLEEFLLSKHAAVQPAEAVGLEGAWGLFYVCLLGVLMACLPRQSQIDNVAEGVAEVFQHPSLLLSGVATVLAIALFNWAGMTITRRVSGATRATVDACRTAIVWLVSMALGWEQFHVLQLLGFTVLLTGTAVYNELITYAMVTRRLQPSSREGDAAESGDAGAEAVPPGVTPIPAAGRLWAPLASALAWLPKMGR